MSDLMSDTAVLVNSCDKNEVIWEPFFTLFNKYTSGCFKQVVLNTERKKYCSDFVETFNDFDDASFSSRLLKSLQLITTKYVILFLDDYFLQDYINISVISDAKNILETNEEIMGIYFKKIKDSVKPYNDIFDYVEEKQYIINFQVGIWRRTDLIKAINDGFSAWDIENIDHLPSELSHKHLLCYCDTNNLQLVKGEPFPYLWALKTGYGVCKGLFLWNNKKLFKKEKIVFDYRKVKKISYFSYVVKSKLGISINK